MLIMNANDHIMALIILSLIYLEYLDNELHVLSWGFFELLTKIF